MPELKQCQNCDHYQEEFNTTETPLGWGWCKLFTNRIYGFKEFNSIGPSAFQRVQVSYNYSCTEQHSKH